MSTSPALALTARGYPLSGLFVPFPFVCFFLALLTDIAYWQSSYLMWQNFSAWLLFAGLVGGALALIAGAIDLLRPRTLDMRPTLSAVIAFVATLVLAFVNSFVHAGDGWTAVVPYGLILSAVTVIVIVVTVFISAEHRTAIHWRLP
ncbi:DUF2231 domain-containing protein [Ciceribacter sp. L1K23]|uniref:DUF2231 domain-containing protein n=1 Tax=Ciceribacter sp. L1K23 TaxID=2820276 RepID=UPI001B82276E|nr:DUF2231 domain-containing protein [Ciceribacter sp. L1K23]MBR0556742.1 DUF2231 domain-containing protein [Ciceribacter sp. L1K23]